MNRLRCLCCGTPLDEWSRSDRRTCSTTCRVALWRLKKAAPTANPHRAEAEPMAASTRRYRAA